MCIKISLEGEGLGVGCCKDTLFPTNNHHSNALFPTNSHHSNALFPTNIICFNAFFQANIPNPILILFLPRLWLLRLYAL